MKNKFIKAASLIVLAAAVILGGASAEAITFTFSDRDFIGGASWGSMDITASGASQLMVTYTASPSTVIPSGSQATGFGFTFVPSTVRANSITNVPDLGNLNWTIYTNYHRDGSLNIPNPSNGDEFTPPVDRFDFFFGVTEGNANNINPPGIRPGNSDTYYLNFTGLGTNLLTANLADFIALTGVRLQSLPDNINGGSLFLAGREQPSRVPEPATLLLVGSGLLGFGIFKSRRKR